MMLEFPEDEKTLVIFFFLRESNSIWVGKNTHNNLSLQLYKVGTTCYKTRFLQESIYFQKKDCSIKSLKKERTWRNWKFFYIFSIQTLISVHFPNNILFIGKPSCCSVGTSSTDYFGCWTLYLYEMPNTIPFYTTY